MAHPMALVGREQELARAVALLRGDVRLLTLTGPVGVGKSCLSWHVAAELEDDFGDGVLVVRMDAVCNAEQVEAELRRVLSVDIIKGRGAVQGVWGCGREMLLVLDGFEHVADAGQVITM